MAYFLNFIIFPILIILWGIIAIELIFDQEELYDSFDEAEPKVLPNDLPHDKL